jgi:chemotaxis protein CheD
MEPLPRALPGFKHIKRYWDHRNHCWLAKILPGEYYVTRYDEILMTVVGSCVAACIRDNVRGIGGMNHFMLPEVSIDKWENTGISAANRYGSFAMEHLINDILKHGGRRENLELKLFGGGRIMRNMTNIGQKNIEFVKNYVRTESLTLLAEDLGSIYPRKILYFPANGRVRVKKLRAIEQIIVQREKAYQRSLETQPIAGDIDLF